MPERGVELAGLAAAAQRYVDRWRPGRPHFVSRLTDRTVQIPEDFCRRVADHFARQPRFAWSQDLAQRYALLRQESARQFEAIAEVGIRVEPWLAEGQPYRGLRQLRESVQATGTLHVYLTRDGHGPRPDPAPHPMRGRSGISRSGVELSHNDVFRAVHDVFGHLMSDSSMGPVGEFRATYCHMAMYSDDVHPVLFTEQISQICWFFYGPHLRTGAGHLPRRGEPGWVPPARRPYAEQKVFACPPRFLAQFKSIMEGEPR